MSWTYPYFQPSFLICTTLLAACLLHRVDSLRSPHRLTHTSRELGWRGERLVLNVVDNPDVLNAADTVSVAMNTFVASVFSRISGVIIGNILAAAFVKFALDFVQGKIAKEAGDRRARSGVAATTTDLSIPPDAWIKLIICIAIDILGDSSFALPGLGEVEDVAWAPLSSLALNALFGSGSVAGIDFVKEILPGTDIIPVATLAWLVRYVFPSTGLASALGLAAPTENGSKPSKKG